jgi:hypothetical protein
MKFLIFLTFLLSLSSLYICRHKKEKTNTEWGERGHLSLDEMCDSDNLCDEGYHCVDRNMPLGDSDGEAPDPIKVCKRKEGRSCTKHSDCAPNNFCNFEIHDDGKDIYICKSFKKATQYMLGINDDARKDEYHKELKLLNKKFEESLVTEKSETEQLVQNLEQEKKDDQQQQREPIIE